MHVAINGVTGLPCACWPFTATNTRISALFGRPMCATCTLILKPVPQAMLNLVVAAAAFGLNMSVFLLIGKTSALTMNVAGVIKDWMLIGLSVLLFHAEVCSDTAYAAGPCAGSVSMCLVPSSVIPFKGCAAATISVPAYRMIRCWQSPAQGPLLHALDERLESAD